MIADLCILVLFSLFILRGYKNGFIKSIYSIISLVATILILSVFKDSFVSFISETQIGVAIGEFFAKDSTDSALVKLCSEKIVYFVFVVIFYVVIRLVLKLALTVIDSIASLPIINSLNKFLGIITGIFTGAIWIIVIVNVLSGVPQTSVYIAESYIIEHFNLILI